MPVVREGIIDHPDFPEFSAMGTVTVKPGQDFDLHYHDCNEAWIIVEGRARVASEGVEYEVGPGDVVLTKMGDEHIVLEAHEEVVMCWVEGELRGERRRGHLHR